MLGQPIIHFDNVLGDVCHNRNQTLCCVVHVVLQRHILERQFEGICAGFAEQNVHESHYMYTLILVVKFLCIQLTQ